MGEQGNGIEGVDKRIDVLATAIKGMLTVDDLEHLELAYAPPFGSAKDPSNTAGFSANNMRSGRFRPVYDLPDTETTQLVDSRPAEMAKLKPIPGALNIPFPELRSRLGALDRSKPVTTICALGKMSYFAARILEQNGFDVRAHVGGWKVAEPRKNITLSEAIKAEKLSEATASTVAETVIRLDCTGMACPGPILRVKEVVTKLERGQILEIVASDVGFKNDLPAFCKANGYECLGVEKAKGIATGRVRKGEICPIAGESRMSPVLRNGATLVVFSGDLEKAMASFIIANGAVAMGGKATMFFTFWGLNVLRKDPAPKVEGKGLMDRLFGWMLPRGANRLPLSQMHMGGLGTWMMKGRMADKQLPNLPGLMEEAKKSGIRLVACTMSMEAMGIREEELIDGIELGGVAEYLGAASETSANLFI